MELTNGNLIEEYSNGGGRIEQDVQTQTPPSAEILAFAQMWNALTPAQKESTMVTFAQGYILYTNRNDLLQAKKIDDKFVYVHEEVRFRDTVKRITDGVAAQTSTSQGSNILRPKPSSLALKNPLGSSSLMSKFTFTKDFIIKARNGSDKVLFSKGQTIIGRAVLLKGRKTFIRIKIRAAKGGFSVGFMDKYLNIPIAYFQNQTTGTVPAPVPVPSTTPPTVVEIPGEVVSDIPANLVEPVKDNEPSDTSETEKTETKKSGLPTWAWFAIGGVVLGTIAFFVLKKKKLSTAK